MSTVIKDISALTETAQLACRTFLYECEAAGLSVRITETYRSQQRQNELYAQGRTTAGSIVTWTTSSRHTSRRAWDICKNVQGQEYSDLSFFNSCGEIAKSLGITWGGIWSTPDRPHFEVGSGWNLPKDYTPTVTNKEELDMEELNKLKEAVEALTAKVTELENGLPKVYHLTGHIPEWGRQTVQRMLDRGIFSGESADDLNISEDMVRMFVVLERAGLL